MSPVYESHIYLYIYIYIYVYLQSDGITKALKAGFGITLYRDLSLCYICRYLR